MDAPRAESPRWLWIALIWSGIGLFDATQTVFVMRSEGMQHAWVRLFFVLLVSWLPWALATPLIVSLGRRYPPTQLRPVYGWFVHLGTALTIELVTSAWVCSLEMLLNPYAHPERPGPFLEMWFDRFRNQLLTAALLYAFVLTISAVLDSRQRLARQQTETARLNEQLSKAQLSALKRQIEPHFLFNTLNAIAGLVRERKNDAAVSMIVGLSDFLRSVLEDSNRQQVPLQQEMEFLEQYLAIQKVRFAERLQLTMDVPDELLPAQVPSLVLQPLVENAIKHGIAKRAQGGAIRVAASRANGMLSLRVYNDGPILPAGWENTQPGIGISNLRTRLQGLYGSRFQLDLRNEGASGVEVSVTVPFEEE